jgi:hypothetical protein
MRKWHNSLCRYRCRIGHHTEYCKEEHKNNKHYNHWLRTLKKGVKVSACYDGKYGRAVEATVVKNRKGVIVCNFTRWVGEGTTRVRFVEGVGYDIGGELMNALGVCDKGDYYRIRSIKECPPKAKSGAQVLCTNLLSTLQTAS